MIFCCGGWFYCIVNPPIRGDFLWWKYTLFWHRSMGWGPVRLNIWYSSLEVCFSFSWSPFFRHPPFWSLSGCHLFWRVKSSFLFTVILPPSFFGGLGPVLFFIFLVFFVLVHFRTVLVMHFTIIFS